MLEEWGSIGNQIMDQGLLFKTLAKNEFDAFNCFKRNHKDVVQWWKKRGTQEGLQVPWNLHGISVVNPQSDIFLNGNGALPYCYIN